MNPVHPSLLARAVNRIAPRAASTTADGDITRREWLFIDIDPRRASGISSTTEELAAAEALLAELTAFLTGEGWQQPLTCMSGNGYYALYPIELPNDAGAVALVKRVLEALAARFDTAAAHVDTGVFNAARIIALIGTKKMKGDPTADRPHRRSCIVSTPDTLAPVTRAQLEQLAGHGCASAAAKPALVVVPRSNNLAAERSGCKGCTPALPAKERALLALHALKEDRQAPLLIRWTLPDREQPAYHRLISTINALNCELASVIMVLHEQAEKASLRLAWLLTTQVWGSEVGVLCDWLLSSCSDLNRTDRKLVRQLRQRAPTMRKLPFDLTKPVEREPDCGDELGRALAISVRDALLQHWPEVRAIEIVVQETAEELDGEDPLHPDVRRQLDETKRTLAEVHEGFAPFAGTMELPEPEEDAVGIVRKLIETVIKG